MNNSSDHDSSGLRTQEPLFDISPFFTYSVASLYIVIVVVAIIGNLMVSYAILADRNLRNNPTKPPSPVFGNLGSSHRNSCRAI